MSRELGEVFDDYWEEAKPLWGMDIEAPEKFDYPCGFIKLKERYRVKVKGRRYISKVSGVWS